MSKYLFIGAHTDDIELSCGGTIYKLVQEHYIHCLSFSFCNKPELGEEYDASLSLLGVNFISLSNFPSRIFTKHRQDILNSLYSLTGFDFIFTHSVDCIHQDHKVIARESLRAFKGKNLITYSQPWNTNENPNYFVELSEQQLEKKIEALACYKSQAHRAYMSPDFIRAQARYNGIKCGKLYAEAFKIERLIQ